MDVAQNTQSYRNPTFLPAKANSGQTCDNLNAHCSSDKYDFESTHVYVLVLLAHVRPLFIYHPHPPLRDVPAISNHLLHFCN